MVGAIVVTAAFALYLATAAHDIVFGDTPELTTAAITVGVPHPPGYPLFTMLGWLFAQLPIDTLPFRVTLLSVVCHAATVGVVYVAGYRFARSVAAGVVAAALLAVEPLFWSWSLVAEVFPLNDLLGATLLLLVALWHEQPQRKWLLIVAALVGGLGMADQQTIALLAPAVVYILWRRRAVLLADGHLVVFSALAFLLGLVPYAQLLIAASRNPAWSWGDLHSVGDLVAHVLRTRYGTGALINEPGFIGGNAFWRIVAAFTAFGPAQLVVLAVGTVYAWRAARWYATYLLLAFAFTGPAFAAYANLNIDTPLAVSVLQRFFLLAHTAVMPLAGFAVLAAAPLARRMTLAPRMIERGIAALAAFAAFGIVALNYAALDRHDDHAARTYAMDVLATVKQNGILFAGGDGVAFPVLYLQTVEHVRPDVATVFTPVFVEDWYVRELRRAHPDLVLKQNGYGAGAGPFRAFLDDNRARPMAMVGDFVDDSTKNIYWLYPRGITNEVRPIDQGATLEDLSRDNDTLLASYHLPGTVKLDLPFRPWERLIVDDYAHAYYRVGSEYENAANNLKASSPDQAKQGFGSARTWYERALGVDPNYTLASLALQRLPKS